MTMEAIALRVFVTTTVLVSGTPARLAPGTTARLVQGTTARLVQGTTTRLVQGTTTRLVQGTTTRLAPWTTTLLVPETSAQWSLGDPDAPLDLRWVLFAVLALAVAAALAAIAVDRRVRRVGSGEPGDVTPGDASVATPGTGPAAGTLASPTLLSDLGHELRTPLATILTHLEVLGAPAVAEDVRRMSLALTKDEAQRMARLVYDVLELGRLEAGGVVHRRPTDLAAVAEEAVRQVSPQASEAGVTVTLDARAAPPRALGDADQLRRVLLNMLDNAVKHGGAGTEVVVTIDRAPGGVRCAVRDDGPGIPPEHLARVAERFYRVPGRDAVAGSGLGLALAAEIVRRHEGRLEIESPLRDGIGESLAHDRPGTRVWFVIPEAS